VNSGPVDLKTFSRKDPDFYPYLLGTFSKTHRALPLKSLNVGSDLETITFQIVDSKQIERPTFVLMWAQIFKIHTFILVAFPMFVVLLKNLMDNTVVNPLDGVLAALGALCLHTSLNLRNDFVDHVRGLDRVLPSSGSRAIQNGWVTAWSVKAWAWVYFVLGVLFGIKPVYDYPQVLIFISALSVLGLVLMSSHKMGFKYRQWSELIVFLLLGPFLTAGFQMSLGAGFDFEALVIGVLTGWFGVFYLHIRNFELLMVTSQAKFRNTMTLLGFDSSKKLLAVWWSIWILGLLGYHFVYSSTYWTVILLLGSLFASWAFLMSLSQLTSPLGSDMTRFLTLARKAAFFVLSLWFVENIFYLMALQGLTL
jgi:1,4-dihydroxy-2-naphthoate octaprenyltransferase